MVAAVVSGLSVVGAAVVDGEEVGSSVGVVSVVDEVDVSDGVGVDSGVDSDEELDELISVVEGAGASVDVGTGAIEVISPTL